MANTYTLPIEFYDGNGDGNNRKVVFLEQAGRIRTRDKNLNSTLSRRRLARQTCHANSPEYKKEQEARVEAARQRVLLEMAILRSKGINPCQMYTAGRFDALEG